MHTRIGTLASGLMLVVGTLVLTLALSVNGDVQTVAPAVGEPNFTEPLAALDEPDVRWIDDLAVEMPQHSTDASALFNLEAEFGLLRLRQSAGEPPANPPPAPVYAPSESPADEPVASHLTRRGWPNTTAQTTLAPRAKNPPTQGRWIDVNIARQTVTAYIGAKPIKTVLTSTGTRLHPTVVGTYKVYAKVPSQTMTGGSRAAGDYYRLPGVPNIMYFYQGYALHGTYWHRNFGHPMSHGCVNLTLADATWFFGWTPMRTIVRPHY